MTAIAVAAALALVIAPGACAAYLVGLRPMWAVPVGPAVTCGIAAVALQAHRVVGLPWSARTVAPGLALLVLAAAARPLLTRRLRSRPSRAGAASPAATSALAVAAIAAVPVAVVAVATRGLRAIPQDWDGIFHGAAVRWIADTGRAGDLAAVAQPANPHFYYPDTYHALTALLCRLPGVGVPTALDAMSAATGAVAVAAVAALTGRLTGRRRAAVVAAAFVAGAWLFPYRTLGNGPLLPFTLGVAVIPGLMLLADLVCRPAHARDRARPASATGGPDARLATRRAVLPDPVRSVLPPLLHGLLLGLALAGAWSVHPSVALAAALPLTVQAVTALVARRRRHATGPVLLGLVAALVPAAGYVLATVDPGAESSMADFAWPREMGVGRALVSVLDTGAFAPLSVLAGALTLLGVVAAVRAPGGRRAALAAPLVTWLVIAVVFVLAAAVSAPWVRLVTSYWWDDRWRFAALLVIPSAVLAGAGSLLLPRVRSAGAAAPPAVVAVLLCLGAVPAAGALHTLGYGDGPAVNAGERAVMDRLAERYTGGTVLQDPFDGTAWVYALHGVPVLFPTPLSDDPDRQAGPERMDLYTSMDRYGFDPMVAQRVHALDVRWVLVGSGSVGGPGRPPGFVGLARNPYLRAVATDRQAVLYQVLPAPAGAAPVPAGIPERVPAEQLPDDGTPYVGDRPAAG